MLNVTSPISIHIAFTKARYEGSDSFLLFLLSVSQIISAGAWQRGKPNRAKQRLKGNSCVVSLNSRFILVLLLWLQCGRKMGGKVYIPSLITWLYFHHIWWLRWNVLLDCGPTTSQIKRFNKTGAIKGESLQLLCAYEARNIVHAQEKTTQGGKKGKHLVTYLLNKCNIGVYVWQDWRAGIMNGFSEVI